VTRGQLPQRAGSLGLNLKQRRGVKIQRFSSCKRQYLENGSRYGQSYY